MPPAKVDKDRSCPNCDNDSADTLTFRLDGRTAWCANCQTEYSLNPRAIIPPSTRVRR